MRRADSRKVRLEGNERLEPFVDLLEEQRLLASMDRSYCEQGAEIHEEMAAWDATLLDGLPGEIAAAPGGRAC